MGFLYLYMARKRAEGKPRSSPPRKPPTAPKQRDPKTGRYLGKEATMRQNSYGAFLSWYDDRKPRIKTSRKYEHVKLTRKQRTTLKNMLRGDGKGGFVFSRILLVWPRRHSKSNLMRLIILWLLDTREHLTIQLWGNSEAHSRLMQYNPLMMIIQQTPALRKRIPERNMMKDAIQHPNGSRIQAMVGGSVVFGDKLDILWLDDFHHNKDLESVNALKASLWDQKDSLTLISSNVDPVDGHVHQMQKAWKKEPKCYVDHLEYMDWEHYETMAPPWINRADVKLDKATTLPAEWDRDVLGKRTQAINSLFELNHLQACQMPYGVPVKEGFRELVKGRAVKIGAGLDRAKSLLGTATGGDNTIFTVVAKVARHDGEPEIFILDQIKVVPNTAQHIKKLIRDAHERYKLDNLTLEDYQAMDIEPWCIEQDIPVELVTAHSSRQNAMFPELHRIVKEGRLHFPKDLDKLVGEMTSFQYTSLRDGKYSFGASGKGHDDRVYSLGWAIYSLRKEILANYVLGNIQCLHKGQIRQMCMLLGGDLELSCSSNCVAFNQVKDMHQEFKRFYTESDLDICQFYQRYVKVTGSLIYQAA